MTRYSPRAVLLLFLVLYLTGRATTTGPPVVPLQPTDVDQFDLILVTKLDGTQLEVENPSVEGDELVGTARASQLGLAEVRGEEEYQKRSGRHGNRLRPDLIVHRPTPEGEEPTAGNHLVIALKRRATQVHATDDFSKLDRVIDDLGYSSALFVNIDSDTTHAAGYAGPHSDLIHCAACHLADGEVVVVYERPGVA